MSELSEKLPDEIFQLVESFKNVLREQKAFRGQKFVADPIIEVGREIDDFVTVSQRVFFDHDKNSKLVQQIKDDTQKLLKPFYSSAGQPNQSLNMEYFTELAEQFELRMKAYAELMKELKMSLDSIKGTYNVDELFRWLKKQHETLGEIAAKIYMTHERILEKENEMNKQQQPKPFI